MDQRRDIFTARGLLVMLSVLSVVASAQADVLTMKDGRTITGEIVSDRSDEVTVDAMVAGIRAKLTLDRAEIGSIVKEPLPEGFFDRAEAQATTQAGPGSDDSGARRAILVPVRGDFADGALADGIETILRYASRQRVGNVVFDIESEGGDLHQASEIYDLLKRYSSRIEFDGIIRRCCADALAIGIWCETIVVVPGAVIGGGEPMPTSDERSASIMLAQIVNEITDDLTARGRNPTLIAAMIDPDREVGVWRGADGDVRQGSRVPHGVSEDHVLVDCPRGELLRIGHDEAVAMGLRSFDGDMAHLGEALGYDGFDLDERYGAEAIDRATLQRRKRQQSADATFERRVERNVRAREKTGRLLERSVRNAAQTDPSKGTYERYAGVYRWGWGTITAGGTGSWTNSSRQEWRNRTDASIRFLQEAANAALEMQRLDREAVRLGLEPTFKDGELRWMIDDLQMKYTSLRAGAQAHWIMERVDL